MNEIEILHPVRELKIEGGETVTIRELRWSEALELFRRLSGHAGKLINITSDGRIQTEVTVARIGELITGADDLAGFLVEKSAGKDPAWLGNLSVSDALTVINGCVALNVTEDILGKAKALGRHFAVIAPGASLRATTAATASAKHTTS